MQPKEVFLWVGAAFAEETVEPVLIRGSSEGRHTEVHDEEHHAQRKDISCHAIISFIALAVGLRRPVPMSAFAFYYSTWRSLEKAKVA